ADKEARRRGNAIPPYLGAPGSFKRLLGGRFTGRQLNVGLEELLGDGDEHLGIGVYEAKPVGFDLDQMLGELAGSRAGSNKTIDAPDICFVLVLGGWFIFDADGIPV